MPSKLFLSVVQIMSGSLYLTADILTNFCRNVHWVVFYQTYEFCPNRWIWLVAMATGRINSRTLASTKIVFFIAVAHVLSLLWQLKVSIDLGKVNIGLYCYHCRYFEKVLQRCSLSSRLPNIWNLSKALNVIGCHWIQKDKFAKKYSKIIPGRVLRSHKGNEAETLQKCS